MTVNTARIIEAFKAIAAEKSLEPDEVNELIRDGIHAGLARIYGANVDTEITVDDIGGDIEMIVLKRVVESVEDQSSEVSLDEARWDDPTYEVGDIMEIPVEFSAFGRNAVMAAKQRIVQLVREGERQRIRDEYTDRVGELLSGEVQQIERGKLVLLLNRSRDAEGHHSLEGAESAGSVSARANPSGPFSRRSTKRRRVPASSSPARTPSSWRRCSGWRCPRSTRGSSRSRS